MGLRVLVMCLLRSPARNRRSYASTESGEYSVLERQRATRHFRYTHGNMIAGIKSLVSLIYLHETMYLARTRYNEGFLVSTETIQMAVSNSSCDIRVAVETITGDRGGFAPQFSEFIFHKNRPTLTSQVLFTTTLSIIKTLLPNNIDRGFCCASLETKLCQTVSAQSSRIYLDGSQDNGAAPVATQA